MGQLLQLAAGIGKALGLGEHPHKTHAQRRLGVGARQITGDQGFGRRGAGQHLKRQQHRAGCCGIVGLGGARQAECLRQVARSQVRPAQRHPAGGAGAGCVQVGQYQFFNQRQRTLAVLHTLQQARQAGNQPRLLHHRHGLDPGRQRLLHLIERVQRQQDLGQVAQRCNTCRLGRTPGFCGVKCLVTGAGLQGNFNCALKQGVVVVALGGVQDDTVSIAGAAGVKLQLTHQQLVEQQRVE